MQKILVNLLVCVVAVVGIITQVFAAKTDSAEPATVLADHATYDRNTGVGVYIGHVFIKQGSTEVRADKLLTYSDKKNQLHKAIAIGKPASYQTMSDAKDQLFKAVANKIIYNPGGKTIKLMGDAVVSQGSSVMKSPYISYDTENGVVKTKPMENQRTVITFNPNDLPKNTLGPSTGLKP